MTERDTDNVAKDIIESSADNTAHALSGEVLNQLSDYAQGKQTSDNIGRKMTVDNSFFRPTEKEREEGIKKAGDSLDAMVKGDIPKLRERLKELGVSTKELDDVEKKLTEKVETAKPLQEAILKGDAAALQKLVGSMDPKQLEEMAELIQKNLDKSGAGLEVDFTDGKLILSRTNGDRGVAISKDGLNLVGINKDGSYDFNRIFRHGKPAEELQSMGESATMNFVRPWNSYIKDASPVQDVLYKNYYPEKMYLHGK